MPHKKTRQTYFRARKSSSPDIKSHYKRFRAHVQKVIRDAYWKLTSNIFSFDTDRADPDCPRKNEKAKKFWSFVKSLKKDTFGINSLRENGILKTDTLDKANICNRQFESAFTREPDTEIPSKGTSPVFKKCGKYNAANYRPVSLTCICCKTLDHIIVSNINKHLAFESDLADCQHGFRSQRSCETQLVQFYHDMVSNLDGALDRGQKQTDVIIMDFAKAFDKVPHRRLWYKLDYYGTLSYPTPPHPTLLFPTKG